MKRLRCTHPGRGHALVSIAQDGGETTPEPVCEGCAAGIVRRALREGYVRGSCADAVVPAERGRHGWWFRDVEREDLCAHCGRRRGWCVVFDGAYGRAAAGASA